jgi:hypothetical protein
MIAQAEHIPVHLGAMPDAVAAVMRHAPGPSEVWAINDPYTGGTHLPDITLVSRTEVGFAVTRAHHADVGGREPGSMPADSTMLEEEGVVIPPTRLDDDVVESLVARMRNPDERRGDLRAQLAAHRLAEQRIAELVGRRGREKVTAAMAELYAYSDRVTRAGIAALPDGRYEARDVLEAIDGDLELRAAVTIAGDSVAIDFDGTAPQHDGNLNCPLSVARSACFHVVRVLGILGSNVIHSSRATLWCVDTRFTTRVTRLSFSLARATDAGHEREHECREWNDSSTVPTHHRSVWPRLSSIEAQARHATVRFVRLGGAFEQRFRSRGGVHASTASARRRLA